MTSGGLDAGTARSRALAMAVPGAPYVLRSGFQAALQQPTFELAKEIDETVESLLTGVTPKTGMRSSCRTRARRCGGCASSPW